MEIFEWEVQSTFWLNLLSQKNLISWALIASIIGVALILSLFVMINGSSKLEHGFSGKKIRRWSKNSIIIHWIGAISCLALIISGLVIGAGKLFFSPDSANWGLLANSAATLHEVTAFPFMFGGLVMILMWWKKQLFKRYDINWFKTFGGYINFGKKHHPDAGFANGGEKLWFWVFSLCFIVLSVTGLMLFFPSITPGPMVTPLIIALHILSALVLGAFSVVHIFMAAVISEGGLSGMVDGHCDENWAKQHHNLWYQTLEKD